MSPIVFPERPRVAVPCGCSLGESPVWDARSGILLWVDIKRGELFRWRPGRGEAPETFAVGAPLGFAVPTVDPDLLLLGRKDGVARFRPSSGEGETVLRPEPDRPGNRLNDAHVGPDGALWFGTMDDGEAQPTGGLYRWSAGGLHAFGERAVVTNGPAVDRENGWVYAADTPAGRIDRYRIGPDGEPGAPEPFVAFRPGDGHPDGLTVDREGHVWACHWGGARITRFDPTGRAVLVVAMPTAQVTKLAFGGPDLATIYVTTAAIGRDRETDPLAGHLFAFEAGIAGQGSEPCRMGLPAGP